jgi:hypothetical protein
MSDEEVSKLEPYKYESLKPGEIRVLVLTTSASGKNQPELSLRHIALPSSDQDERRGFDALSYTWGDLSKTFRVKCDGRTLKVHQNLYEALPFLAQRSSTRPLWIDAVCINQEDDAEKSSQIRLMCEIYSSAYSVWIWLGPAEEPGAHNAVTMLLPRLKAVQTQLQALPTGGALSQKEAGLPPFGDSSWASLENLMSHPWLKRLWIVQEVALARLPPKVLIGTNEIAWQQFADMLNIVHLLPKIKDEQGRGVVDSSRSLRGVDTIHRCRTEYQTWKRDASRPPDHVLDVVTFVCALTLRYGCSKPRDRVFALAGLLGNHSAAMRWNLQTPVEELYTEFMSLILNGPIGNDWVHYQWWALFSEAIQKREKYQLPSWCPDLEHAPDAAASHHVTIIQIVADSTRASSAKIRARRGRDHKQVVVTGKVIDTIDQLGDTLQYEEISSSASFIDLFLSVQKWECSAAMLIASLENSSSSKDDQMSTLTGEEYWLTIIGDQTKSVRGLSLKTEDFNEMKNALSAFSVVVEKIGKERFVVPSSYIALFPRALCGVCASKCIW